MGDLDKAHGAHAEKQVQVTAEDAEQLLAAHLRLLAVLLVLCAVVAQRELHICRVHVRGQVGDDDLARLAGIEVADARKCALVRVEVAERILVAGDILREYILCTLERTARQAVFGQSQTIDTREVVTEAHATKLDVFEHEVVVVLTRARHVVHELRARGQAGGARVRVVALDDHVEYRSIEWIGVNQCVLLIVEHLALAVGRGILLVRGAFDVDAASEASGEQNGR